MEQIGDIFFPQVVEEIMEVVQAFPREDIIKRTGELFDGESRSRVMIEIVEVVRQERCLHCTVEQTVDVSVPRIAPIVL